MPKEQNKQSGKLGQLGKRRVFLTAILMLSAVSVVWFTIHPLKQSYTVTEQPSSSAEKNGASVPYYAMNLTSTARANLAREFAAYNVYYAPKNYYTMLGSLLDSNQQVIYNMQTIAKSCPEESYEFHRNLLCMYLYGDTISAAEPIMGIEALMRTANEESEDFIQGSDVCLTLHSALEQPIYDLLQDNGISGGCILQDTATGRIEVMTATSRSAENQSGTVSEALRQEKSGLSQLEPCISPEALHVFGLDAGTLAEVFDYHALSSVSTASDGENGAEEILRYHFMTDFDLLDESEDGRISPLHLNAVTQQIFSGKKTTPMLMDSFVTGNEKTKLLQPQSGGKIPSEILSSCLAVYEQEETTEDAVLKYRMDEQSDFLYVTGRIQTKDGSRDKCFTLYARNPRGENTRNRCILQLPKCIAYYIAHEEETA
ncbi:MAG: hypothetical protein MJ071_02080 [Oscillospiraceae bacterium]|nr:hypothetical protein [Oscillospiraceae bacterium]